MSLLGKICNNQRKKIKELEHELKETKALLEELYESINPHGEFLCKFCGGLAYHPYDCLLPTISRCLNKGKENG